MVSLPEFMSSFKESMLGYKDEPREVIPDYSLISKVSSRVIGTTSVKSDDDFHNLRRKISQKNKEIHILKELLEKAGVKNVDEEVRKRL